MSTLRDNLRNTFIPHQGNEYHPHALRRPWLHVYGGVLITVKIFAIAFVSLYAGLAQQSSITPQVIISQTNQARRQQGLANLQSNSLLAKAAEAKAHDMVTKGYFAHISPSNVTPWYWFKQAGYKYSYAGENLAIDYVSSEDVIQAWLNSPSHRANLLNARYQDIGIAVASGMINGSESVVVVQMFGAPVKAPIVQRTTAPKQSPDPVIAKQQLAKQPPTKPITIPTTTVLPKPVITSPAAQSIVQTKTPVVVGTAEPGSEVKLVSGETTLTTAGVGSDGVFTLVPVTPLAEGNTTLSVLALGRGQSAVSDQLSVVVDSQAPSMVDNKSFALSSLTDPGAIDLWVTTSSDTTAVDAHSGKEIIPLTKQGGSYIGHLPLGSTPGLIQVVIKDQVGNTTVNPLLDVSLFQTGVVISEHGPGSQALRVLFFSRAFLSLFLILMVLATFMNLMMNWRRQHHPALMASLLLVYVTGVLILL